jgi:hypothetical protein
MSTPATNLHIAADSGWARVRDIVIGDLAILLPTIVLLGLLAWIIIRVLQDIREDGGLGWRQAAILVGYFVVFVTLLTVPEMNWIAIAGWAAAGMVLLEIPKAFIVRSDYRRARVSSLAIVGFCALMLAVQLARGEFTPSWWPFSGVILGAVASFAFLEDMSLYGVIFGPRKKAGNIFEFRRKVESGKIAS